MNDRLILNSKAGTFYFFRDALMSHAKLIRDAITGEIMNPKRSHKKIRNSADAVQYIVSECAGTFAKVPFTFVPSSERR